MIKDPKEIIEHIAKFLYSYHISNDQAGYLIPYDGSRHSALLIHLAQKTNVNFEVFIYSDNDKYKKLFDNTAITKIRFHPIGKGTTNIWHEIQHYANINKLIILGFVDKTFGLFSRDYHKHEDYTADIFPLYDLFYSDIISLYNFAFPNSTPYLNSYDPEYIRLVEWAIKLNPYYNEIITSEDRPEANIRWHTFTYEQKKVISNMHQREKATRHKRLDDKPFCTIPKRFID